MKKNLLLAIMLLSVMFAMAQSSIIVKFTAEDQNGNYFQLDAVKVTSISQNWNQTLAYPDTILILNYIDGIGEQTYDEGILQNRPNPFHGTTEATLNLVEDGQTTVQLFDMKGAVLAEYEANLIQGEHTIKVCLAEPQMALLRVNTAKQSYVAKLLNIGNGGENRIEISSTLKRETKTTKAVGAGPFAPGDVLSYVGIKMQGSDMVLSNNTVTQAQYTDDVVTFVFDVETPIVPQLPAVVTSEVSDITYSTAVCGGEVLSDGGAEVVVRGVCWATTPNPTTSDSHTTDGSGLGEFVSNLSNLTAGATYHVRAYATNGVGTAYGEEKIFTTVSYSLPEVITADVSNITSSTAVCGGEVLSDGGTEVTTRGVCWATNPNPTISDSHTTNGVGLGEFVSDLSNLAAETQYYVRAFATNSVGTAYGDEKTFTTGVSAPEGAINGLFSVSETKQVYFSKGNLQYQASTNTWRFAENQWDFVGCQNPYSGDAGGTVNGSDNANLLPSNTGWIDLFTWGSGDDPINCGSITNHNITFSDWGKNPIENGGNDENIWRTLSKEEWIFLFYDRTTNSDARFAKGQINGINGIILLPDGWNSSVYNLNNVNNPEAEFISNILSLSQWNALENTGAVFLPITGYRTWYNAVYVHYVNSRGCYWSSDGFYSSYNGYPTYYFVEFSNSSLNAQSFAGATIGRAVRLVMDVE